MSERLFKWPEGKDSYYAHPNPDGDPEACGLTKIGEVAEDDLSYEFDYIIAVRDTATGRVFMAHDAGCSCPTPFENVAGLGDMTEVRNVEEARVFIGANNSDRSYREPPGMKYKLADINALLEKIEAALKLAVQDAAVEPTDPHARRTA